MDFTALILAIARAAARPLLHIRSSAPQIKTAPRAGEGPLTPLVGAYFKVAQVRRHVGVGSRNVQGIGGNHANAAVLPFESSASEPQTAVFEVPASAPSGMQNAGQRNGRRIGRNRGDDRAGKPVERPSGSPLPPEILVGATCNPDLLPPGRAVLYGEHEGQWLVRACFAPPQLLQALGIARIAGQLKAPKTFERQNPALEQGLHGLLQSLLLIFCCRRSLSLAGRSRIHKPQARPARWAGHGLGMNQTNSLPQSHKPA